MHVPYYITTVLTCYNTCSRDGVIDCADFVQLRKHVPCNIKIFISPMDSVTCTFIKPTSGKQITEKSRFSIWPETVWTNLPSFPGHKTFISIWHQRKSSDLLSSDMIAIMRTFRIRFCSRQPQNTCRASWDSTPLSTACHIYETVTSVCGAPCSFGPVDLIV